jgi:RNA-directed DNA polymerase
VKAESNPFDPEWKAYFKKRKEYKMLKTLNDTKPLLYLWKKQKGICPLCGKPIDINDSWGTTEKQTTPEKQNYLVHESCRRKNN